VKSNAQRQAEFRAKQRKKGLKQKLIWIDSAGEEVADPEIEASRQRIAELSAELTRKQAQIDRLQGALDIFVEKFPTETAKTVVDFGKFRLIHVKTGGICKKSGRGKPLLADFSQKSE
jgi:uncharacterized coiled-coil protein SlyX